MTGSRPPHHQFSFPQTTHTGDVMKHTVVTPTSLRRPEERYAARALADQLLRAHARRRRRMAANDELGGTAPAPIRTKHEDGPFAALRNHPQYRAPRNGAFRRP
jgi:hypothetical protein